jgi:hypothetical protein
VRLLRVIVDVFVRILGSNPKAISKVCAWVFSLDSD